MDAGNAQIRTILKPEPMENVFETLATILKPEPMEIQHAQFKVGVGSKLHKVEVFFYEDHGQAYEIDGVLIDGNDVSEELFIIEELLGISIILKLQDHINNQ